MVLATRDSDLVERVKKFSPKFLTSSLRKNWVAPWLPGFLTFAGILVLWHALVAFGYVNPVLFPSPVTVAEAAIDFWQRGILQSDLAISLERMAKGFLVGSVLGIVLGVITAKVKLTQMMLTPVLQLLRPIPAIAFVPLAIVWFGLGEASKLFVVAYGVFFPVWVNTFLGVQGVSDLYLRAARSLGATPGRVFVEVLVPASAPFIVAGLRIGIAVGFIGLIAAELTGAAGGIGYRIIESQHFFRVDRMLVGVIQLGIFGALLDLVFGKTARRVVHWG